MSNTYLTPGVYVEDISKIEITPDGSEPVASFMGVATTGPVGVPVLITSWNAYLSTFALGQDTAFLTNSKLAYAVYGFFQNGGKRCYVLRLSNGTVSGGNVTFLASCAASTGAEAFSTFATVFSAKYEGTWANTKLTIEIPKNQVNTTLGTFTLVVKYNGVVVETFTNVKGTANTDGCYADVINSQSDYLKLNNFTTNAPLSAIAEITGSVPTLTFAGGSDGLADSGSPVPDTVYEVVFKLFDGYDDIRLMTAPDGADTVQGYLATYCTEKKRVAICCGTETATNQAINTLRTALNNKNAILYYPWIKVVNPLSTSGSLISIPPVGHICGTYSRISNNRGFWKAPAGTEAVLRGAVSVVKVLTQEETDLDSPLGINAIVSKPNVGVVIWGARSCTSDFPYVTDLYMYVTISKDLEALTQQFVFEPNDEVLWTKAKTVCQDYLNSLYQQGALFGDNSSQAFYVKCDEELNPVSSRNQGKLIIEVGYAAKKPAEFVILRITHNLTTN